MIKYAIPFILIGTSIALFFFFINPLYQEIEGIRALSVSYNEALGNSKALEAERDKLTEKYNTFSQSDIEKLQKLLPDNIDNIRMILEMEKIASPYGMVIRDVKYDASETTTTTGRGVQAGASRSPYGIWNFSFSTEGSYNNFISFLKDLESNLRIVDVSSIEFSAGDIVGLDPNLPISYKYQFSIKTYWLKN